MTGSNILETRHAQIYDTNGAEQLLLLVRCLVTNAVKGRQETLGPLAVLASRIEPSNSGAHCVSSFVEHLGTLINWSGF
jgi:hypothetical protein